jgi:hypothetical protein
MKALKWLSEPLMTRWSNRGMTIGRENWTARRKSGQMRYVRHKHQASEPRSSEPSLQVSN